MKGGHFFLLNSVKLRKGDTDMVLLLFIKDIGAPKTKGVGRLRTGDGTKRCPESDTEQKYMVSK